MTTVLIVFLASEEQGLGSLCLTFICAGKLAAGQSFMGSTELDSLTFTLTGGGLREGGLGM